MVRGFLSPLLNNDSWLDGAREVERWRDGWSSFPSRVGLFAQQSALESEWASIEPLAGDLPFTLIPESLDGDASTFQSKTTVRLMTEEPEEPQEPNDDGPIVVTGTRPPSEDTYYWYVSDGLTSPEPAEPAWAISADDGLLGLVCHCAGMTEAEKLQQAIDAEVAEIRREMLAMPRQDMEYGSLIYIDSNGEVQHTPLIETPDQFARLNAPALPDSSNPTRDDYSTVVAMVHSHPAYIAFNNTNYYREGNTYLLVPWEGDWISYEKNAALIASSGGSASTFKQYIIGWGDNGFAINEYDAADRYNTTLEDGESIDPNTEACTCPPGL